jgi:hypothetical protein
LDIHADLAITGDLTSTYAIHPQVAIIELSMPPEQGTLTPAIEDVLNLPFFLEE